MKEDRRYLNRYFSVAEFTRSSTAERLGIDNTPSEYVLANLSILANSVLLKPRMQMGIPFRITSGYRCERLNIVVGGVSNSYHLDGRACDIVFDNMDDMRKAAKLIAVQPLCDLVLLEKPDSKNPWLHVQWSYTPRHKVSIG